MERTTRSHKNPVLFPGEALEELEKATRAASRKHQAAKHVAKQVVVQADTERVAISAVSQGFPCNGGLTDGTQAAFGAKVAVDSLTGKLAALDLTKPDVG